MATWSFNGLIRLRIMMLHQAMRNIQENCYLCQNCGTKKLTYRTFNYQWDIMRSTIWLFQLVGRRNLPWIGWVIQVTQLRAHLTDGYVQLSQQFIFQVFDQYPWSRSLVNFAIQAIQCGSHHLPAEVTKGGSTRVPQWIWQASKNESNMFQQKAFTKKT